MCRLGTDFNDMLGRWWNDLPVRWQLMMSISIISVTAILLSMLLAVLDARSRVEAEVKSAMELAQQLVNDSIKRGPAEGRAAELIEVLPSQLKYVRHVRILVSHKNGNLVQVAPDESEDRKLFSHAERAPQWFADFVGPTVRTREVRVMLGDNRMGSVIIAGEPRDELGEVWDEVSRRAVIWLGITAVMLALLYVVLGRLLNPLSSLAGGMQELEDGRYGTRLAQPRVRELAVIAARFNMLAEALEKARAENSRLYRNVIELQEDERRQIASELHDEAGPCLFGITANVSSVGLLSEQVPESQGKPIRQRVEEILGITERLKTINRDLLRRLRPIELGRIPLEELIGSLVAGFGRRHRDVEFSVAIGSLARGYGEAVDLTLFRCVQEGLTNGLRHGGATHMKIELCEKQGPTNGSGRLMRRLVLKINDNGAGFDPGAPMGIGMTAMRERIAGLGGEMSVASEPGGGSTVLIVIPLNAVPGVQTESLEAIEGHV